MKFAQPKLTMESADTLRACPFASMRPYVVLGAPVYVFLRANQKFLCVKGPLDFFTMEELEKVRRFGDFFLPPFAESLEPFRAAGCATRAILTRARSPYTDHGDALPPAPFETSDAVLRAIGPLWSPDAAIEPYFLVAFADELCAPLPSSVLKSARDAHVGDFERALVISSATVFLALHLGYCDIGFLNLLRLESFERVVVERDSLLLSTSVELRQIFGLAFELVGEDLVRSQTSIARDVFVGREERAAQKLHARLGRIEAELIRPDARAATIFGERGLVDG